MDEQEKEFAQIMDEIIISYRMTKEQREFMKHKQEEYSELCDCLMKSLKKDQKEKLKTVIEDATIICIYKCKDYYFKGYDNGIKAK